MAKRIMATAILIFFCSAILSGCQPKIPPDALILRPESLEQRQVQTRRFDTNDEAKVLSACAGLLQDTGFNLDKSETKLGLIVASKERSATSAGQIVTSVLLAFFGVYMPRDRNQKMRASIVTYPAGESGKQIGVRVTFQRIVWDDRGIITKREGLTDPKIYQEFFDKLSKSLFLEANSI